MKVNKKRIFFLVLSICFLTLRFIHLRESVNFGSDQGLQLLEIFNRFQTKTFTLIGPYSSFSTNGKYFYFGPAPYYLPMPILALSRWNPMSMSYFMIALQYLSFVCIYWALSLKSKKNTEAIIYSGFYAFLPISIWYSQFFWNPNFLLSISTIVISLLLLLKKSRHTQLLSLVIGLVLGFGMQFHYSFFIAILLSVGWIFLAKKATVKSLAVLLFGFIIGFSPIIIFELRHDFYNTRTFLLFINSAGKGSFSFQEYYWLSILPFIFFGATALLKKIHDKSSLITPLVMIVLGIYSLIVILPTPQQGFTMVEGWNYKGISALSRIILSEKPHQYNVAEILTGDTRAMPLRYLLTVAGDPPLGVTEYQATEKLFLYTRISEEELNKRDLWELNSVRPFEITKSWPIQNGISLYLLEKILPYKH